LIQIATIVEAGQIISQGLLAKALFAGAQRLFGLFAFGDVDYGDEDASEGIFMATGAYSNSRRYLFSLALIVSSATLSSVTSSTKAIIPEILPSGSNTGLI
jgi:hypothetical protein